MVDNLSQISALQTAVNRSYDYKCVIYCWSRPFSVSYHMVVMCSRDPQNKNSAPTAVLIYLMLGQSLAKAMVCENC